MQEDWPEEQPKKIFRPYLIQFKLSSPPKGTFILHLGAIFRYRHPAPPLYALVINGKFAASYRLRPLPAPQLWWPNGGEGAGDLQYFGYQSIEMQLPASAFTIGWNSIAIRCLDGFGIYYDDLTLTNDPTRTPPLITQATIEPTVLYKRRPSGLVELAKVRVRTSVPIARLVVKARVGLTTIVARMSQTGAGDIETTVELPATEQPRSVSLYLEGSKVPLCQSTFVPKRRWLVYALPMEQADFGYNDLPARTLEWENRFIDKALEIQRRYTSYKFTLDAAANLKSYLSTRKTGNTDQVLELLKNGKWGMNALYANFFTALSTPEELFRALDFSLGASRKFHFPLDSASQTDEPSVTWSLPQILNYAGIKYLANGSDPIRGALNPIGLLNFHSPFYWETPTGSKILVWSGVSYTAVDDMTWGGWNPDSARNRSYAPSVFGLKRSLPLFLSQYDRDDYPFDSVLLYGLHNDEIPMRHWGDADSIELWNREYAFPKIILATQRDFFTHITSAFETKIPTFRGDEGSYWEDEAGADARIAAEIRTAQEQLAAAERFESVAEWLQPHLKFDTQGYDAAWKNILLADSYVWSDANSLRRPESSRTLRGEAAHRAWADAASQQSSDLLLVATDKIAEQIETNQQGMVIFNPESWPRSDFFETDLESDEELVDPATGRSIPCGSIKMRAGYQRVRCWASNVPALGYMFYAIAKGTVPRGETLIVSSSSPTVENEFYRIQFNTQTGGIEHLVDKSIGKELVNSGAKYQLNEYLYVSGGDPGNFIPGSLKDNRLLAADVTLPLPKLTVNRPHLTEPIQALRFPWGIEVIVRSRALNTPLIKSTIILPDMAKQIYIRNDVQKTATLRKEGVYFAFPFALTRPQFKYQIATTWVDPVTDLLPGANRQWFASQGGVWAQGKEKKVGWATVDAPLITLEDINRGLWPNTIQIRNATVFSYAMNNYWYTDTPAQQGGQFTFRYAISSGPDVSSARTMVLAADQRSPLIAIRSYHMGWHPKLSKLGLSFVKMEPVGTRVLTIRPVEHESAYLVRVQNCTSEKIRARLTFSATVLRDAYLGTITGERIKSVDWSEHGITVPMKGNEIETLVIKVRGSE